MLSLPGNGINISSTPKTFCEDCQPAWDISGNGAWLVYGRESDRIIVAREVATGNIAELIRADAGIIARLRISPDDRWVTFINRSADAVRIFVAPFRPGHLTPRDQWVALNNTGSLDTYPAWSPDGSMIYYISDRDGKTCVWVQRFDSSTGRPAGDPVAAWHLHEARRSISGVPVRTQSVTGAPGRLVTNLSESTGNIWMSVDPPRQRQQAN